MVYILVAIICIAMLIVGVKLNKDQGYTIGKGLFKNSEYFIDENKDKPKDASDFDYWNKNQLK